MGCKISNAYSASIFCDAHICLLANCFRAAVACAASQKMLASTQFALLFFMKIEKIVVGMLRANCYLLVDGGEAAVIDPGDEPQKIIDAIEKSGAKLKFIANTHRHFDHIGANAAIAEKFGVEVMANLKDGDILAIGKLKLKVVETSGHTPDGICLAENGFVISGDTLFEDGIGRTDLEGGSDAQMAASLKKLDALIPDGAAVYPGHGDVFIYRKGMAREWLDYLN